MKKFKIRTGDEVVVISGAHKGKFGKVLKVFYDKSTVLVSGVNFVSKHVRPTSAKEGGILSVESPIHVSNVAIRDSETGLPIKLRYQQDGDRKYLASKKTGKEIRAIRG